MKKQIIKNSSNVLGVDIGNTHTVIGLFRSQIFTDSWRVQTRPETTGDELGILLYPLLRQHDLTIENIETVMVSSVVSTTLEAWADMSTKHDGMIFIDAHEIAMELVNIKYPRPHEVGTDRLLNSLAAFHMFKRACIVVDYGTATTFDCISGTGEYMGGAIAPGIQLAAKGLFTGTSKLPMVKFPRERISPLGKSTETAIQAGLLYGFAGLTDNIIDNLFHCFKERPFVVSTGGLSTVLFDYCSKIDRLEPNLTMNGLLHCYKYCSRRQA